MSTLVCGKRSYSHFEEYHSPSSVSSKRCCRLPSSLDTSPPGVSVPDSRGNVVLSHLFDLFPDMDKTIIERVFDECGNDIDAAIKKLKELHIEVAEGSPGPADGKSMTDTDATAEPNLNGVVNHKSGETPFSFQINDVPSAGPADGKSMTDTDATAEPNLNGVVNHKSGETPFSFQINDVPSDGSGWLDLFVSETFQASSIDDFRSRASRLLGILEQNITAGVVAETRKSLQKENTILKEQVESLRRDNNILKHAIAIQHERQIEYNDKIQEFEQVKQLVNQYQERVRSLEINNYALSMHLKQAQNRSSIPGRFHPDVF